MIRSVSMAFDSKQGNQLLCYNIQMAKKIEGAKRPKVEPVKCAVCMEKNAYASISCTHKFCMRCISRWTKRNQTCPLCRTEVNEIRYGKRIKKVEVRTRNKPAVTQPIPRETPRLAWKTFFVIGVPVFSYYYPGPGFYQPVLL